MKNPMIKKLFNFNAYEKLEKLFIEQTDEIRRIQIQMELMNTELILLNKKFLKLNKMRQRKKTKKKK